MYIVHVGLYVRFKSCDNERWSCGCVLPPHKPSHTTIQHIIGDVNLSHQLYAYIYISKSSYIRFYEQKSFANQHFANFLVVYILSVSYTHTIIVLLYISICMGKGF